MSEVEITLNGSAETLRCTLRAAKRVNAMVDGFQGVGRRLLSLDFDTYVAIVAIGLDKKPADVEDAVFQTGMITLFPVLDEYVGRLMNGGELIKPKEDPPQGES
jgi:hypothetical protein